MTAPRDVENRRWKLRGWTKDDDKDRPSHESTCNGDSALDLAAKRLEARADIVRITARLA
ncbi:hypothetical protein QWY28_17500 [Nocardioides sp. SOB77]|uniref:Uncharacterized protein n=1 Tax=Nocardioides oceani TaxID=3058369 RepID=A0ABT8FJR7_9ACTN|nr:hypothetical protein [Nocardioides oceani]MDN4174761.1 hypothetical protein [Nocardioides oceani]